MSQCKGIIYNAAIATQWESQNLKPSTPKSESIKDN